MSLSEYGSLGEQRTASGLMLLDDMQRQANSGMRDYLDRMTRQAAMSVGIPPFITNHTHYADALQYVKSFNKQPSQQTKPSESDLLLLLLKDTK